MTAAKQVQTQGRDDRHLITVVSCASVSESDAFQSGLGTVVQAGGVNHGP